MKKWVKRIIIVLVIIVLAVIGLKLLGGNKSKVPAMIVNDFTVELGTIDSTITGKATIQPNDQYTISAMISGDVLASYFEVGDVVEKDFVMYEIDSSDIARSIESSDLSMKKANMNLEDLNKSIADLTVRSDYTGVTTNVTVELGDTVNNGQVLANIYDDSRMKIKIPFNEMDVKRISVGDTAILTLDGSNNEIEGVVVSINSESYAKSSYMRVKDVEIVIYNPGSILKGDTATAIINDVACNSSGTFEYYIEEVITSTASGEVVTLNIENNKKINKNDIVAILYSESLENQKKNTEISYRESELSRERTLESLDDYTIKAPIKGTVITKSFKAGDTIDNSQGAKTLATIYDLSSLKFDMEVDELDIARINIGQEVKIFADAVNGKEYKGVVESINVKGTSSNGVTVYPVTVRINDFDDKLLPGMNVDAEIVVEKVENVLVVPTECVNRGNTVYVKGDKEDETDMAPDGYKTVKVETGMSDTSYIEIKSGLNEGDVVRGREVTNTNGIMEQMEGMMSGEMPSGMPGGMGGMSGPPSGMAGGPPSGMGR